MIKFSLGVCLCLAAIVMLGTLFGIFDSNCSDGPGTMLSCEMPQSTIATVSEPANLKIVSDSPFEIDVKGNETEHFQGIKADGYNYTVELTTDRPVSVVMTKDKSDGIFRPYIYVNLLEGQNYPTLTVKQTAATLFDQLFHHGLIAGLLVWLAGLTMGLVLMVQGLRD